MPSIKELWALKPKLAPKWRDLCIAIEFDEDGTVLQTIEDKCREDPEKCCEMLLRKWKTEKPPTWQNVIDCLSQTKYGQLTKEVKDHVQSLEINGRPISVTQQMDFYGYFS